VNLSAGVEAVVPPTGLVTAMSTVPTPDGAVARIEPSELTTKIVALTVPNVTAVTPLKPLPVMLTFVPPPSGPALGLTAVITGCGTYVNRSPTLAGVVPSGVATETSTVAVPGGEVAVIDSGELTVKLAASAEPNLTAVTS
jgi:hypothetical protein